MEREEREKKEWKRKRLRRRERTVKGGGSIGWLDVRRWYQLRDSLCEKERGIKRKTEDRLRVVRRVEERTSFESQGSIGEKKREDSVR